MDKVFIYDLDDTLIPNQHDYTVAQLEFIKFVNEKIGFRAPDIQSIINEQVAIDNKRVKDMKFKMERFPGSIRLAYQTICEKLGVEFTNDDLDQAYTIGMLAFDKKRYEQQGLVPHASETLDFLARQGDTLILLTKGDKKVQNMKIEANKLDKWFPQVFVTPTKSAEMLSNISRDYFPKKTWHVGNSIRSDVEPAIQAGIGMIYIPCETWAWEKDHKGLPDYDKLIKIDNIGELPSIYSQLN